MGSVGGKSPVFPAAERAGEDGSSEPRAKGTGRVGGGGARREQAEDGRPAARHGRAARARARQGADDAADVRVPRDDGRLEIILRLGYVSGTCRVHSGYISGTGPTRVAYVPVPPPVRVVRAEAERRDDQHDPHART